MSEAPPCEGGRENCTLERGCSPCLGAQRSTSPSQKLHDNGGFPGEGGVRMGSGNEQAWVTVKAI